jgi:hypothetical protein
MATYDFVENNNRLRTAFEIADQVCLIIFTAECGPLVEFHGYHIFSDARLTFFL